MESYLPASIAVAFDLLIALSRYYDDVARFSSDFKRVIKRSEINVK
jgi:hypothetical protein